MTDHTYAELIAYAKGSTRPPGKCLGFANNDVVSHFGKLGNTPYSATISANELEAAEQLFDSPCPDYPHVDFYHYVTGGVDLGHIDWHFPQHGVHVADSGRTTVKLNSTGTVGTYANWGTRRGWAKIPALNAQISFVNDNTPTPPAQGSGGSLHDAYARVQRALAGRARYQGPDDGVFGINTWKGIQFSVSTRNGNTYGGPLDGKPGPKTLLAVQKYAKQYGDYKGPLDGDPGINTWNAFALGLERP